MKALGIGAVLWDEMPDPPGPAEPVPGQPRLVLAGAVLNVLVHLRNLGHEVWMLSALGTDPLGVAAFRGLARLGVQDRFVTATEAPTCKTGVRFEADGSPRYTIPSLVSWDRIAASQDRADEIDRLGFDVAVFGTLEQRDPVSRCSIRRVLDGARFRTTFVDLTLRGGFYDRELLAYAMGRSDVVKMNDEEASVVNRLFGYGVTDLRRLLMLLCREHNAGLCCITLGERGALIGDSRRTIYEPGYRVPVVDTVGSGDAFSAGLLHRLDQGADLPSACDFANKMGALIASRRGALPAYEMSDLAALTERGPAAADFPVPASDDGA